MKLFDGFWSKVYGVGDGESPLSAIEAYAARQALIIKSYIDAAGSSLSLDSVDSWVPEAQRLVLYNTDDFLGGSYVFDGELTFDGSRLFNSKPSSVTKLKLPPDLKEPFAIADDPVKPSHVYYLYSDYVVEDGWLIAKSDITQSFNVVKFDECLPPKPVYGVWFMGCFRDYRITERLYAKPVGLGVTGPSAALITRICWDMLTDGCSEANLRRMLCAITDTDYLDIEGTVEAVYEEGSRRCVIVDGRLFCAPKSCAAVVSEGCDVVIGEFLFDNAKIISGTRPVSSSDFPMLHLSEGWVGADVEGGISVSNQEVEPPKLLDTVLLDPSNPDVDDVAPLDDKLLVPGGYETVKYEDDTYNKKLLVRVYELPDYRGLEGSIRKFVRRLNEEALANAEAPLGIDANKPLRPWNLFNKYRSGLTGSNTIFVKVRADLAPPGVVIDELLSFMSRTYKAGAILLTFMAVESIVTYSLSQTEEVVEVFLEPAGLEQEIQSPQDRVSVE